MTHVRSPRPRRRDDDIVVVRIAFDETDVRERARRLGGVWWPQQVLWELRWADVRHLGLASRAVDA